ncbi:PREDICTED: cytochrome P450 6k1-like [Dinoponera quadriceps]|uniref:Cytochrome P450 6k1-like n=1 Tax=Dinoponera quadriceps TaxID=609295 RepID=A0A6P3XWQ8_DINQU|nr:PREDICTED: cytochrome P450 6k1-like [Dinoponera quadriceps]XP_014482990.1 PREDICTED: cytochrome P450 6k1-like [Dinoponera quadriceps]XP_014482991.1 PREDICTED: cytochrome P450 6k1-like [Dinoponera quadriceps]
MTNIFFILLALLVMLYLWGKRKHSYWERRGIRSLPGLHWFFGNFKDAVLMRKSSGMLIGDLHKQAADEDDVVGIYILHKPFLLVRNPELIKQMLIKDFHMFPNRHFSAQSTIDEIGSSSLFSISNPKWKHMRTKMSPVFTSGKLKNLFLLMVESAESMGAYLRDQFKGDSKVASFNVKETFYKYTTNVIASMAFGICINSFDTPTPEFYTNSVIAFQQNFLRSVRFFFLFFFPNIGKYFGLKMLGEQTNYFRRVFWNSMDNRRFSKKKRGDLIDSLLQLKNEDATNEIFQFEGDTLIAQAAIFFAAGRETSITTMTYTLCELAKKPEIQKRLRREILEKIEAANGAVTYEAVQDMKYLYQVVSETMRLYPPAPLIDRVPLEDYTFPGTKITVEKGTPVYIALYGLHTDPRYHSNPTTFDPDRFSDERKNEMLPCTFMPFGEGPRNCIGSRLGYLQTAVGLISILQDYEVALNPSWLSTVDKRNVFTTPPMGFQLDLKKI